MKNEKDKFKEVQPPGKETLLEGEKEVEGIRAREKTLLELARKRVEEAKNGNGELKERVEQYPGATPKDVEKAGVIFAETQEGTGNAVDELQEKIDKLGIEGEIRDIDFEKELKSEAVEKPAFLKKGEEGEKDWEKLEMPETPSLLKKAIERKEVKKRRVPEDFRVSGIGSLKDLGAIIKMKAAEGLWEGEKTATDLGGKLAILDNYLSKAKSGDTLPEYFTMMTLGFPETGGIRERLLEYIGSKGVKLWPVAPAPEGGKEVPPVAIPGVLERAERKTFSDIVPPPQEVVLEAVEETPPEEVPSHAEERPHVAGAVSEEEKVLEGIPKQEEKPFTSFPVSKEDAARIDALRGKIIELEEKSKKPGYLSGREGIEGEILKKEEELRVAEREVQIKARQVEIERLEAKSKMPGYVSGRAGIEDEILKREEEIRRLEGEGRPFPRAEKPVTIEPQPERKTPEIPPAEEKAETVVSAEKAAEGISAPKAGKEAPTGPEFKESLTAAQKLDAAIALGLIAEHQIPDKPAEQEKLLNGLEDFTHASSDAVRKALLVRASEKKYRETLGALYSQAQREGKLVADLPGYSERMSEFIAHFRELNEILERDRRKALEKVYPSDPEKVLADLNNTGAGGFRNRMIRMNLAAATRKNHVNYEVWHQTFGQERKPGFAKRMLSKWRALPMPARAAITAAILLPAIALPGAATGTVLALVGWRFGRAVMGGTLSATLQKFVGMPLAKLFKRGDEKKADKEINTLIKEKSYEYPELVYLQKYEKMTDLNMAVGNAVSKRFNELEYDSARKDRKRKILLAVATSAVGGVAGAGLFDMIAGSFIETGLSAGAAHAEQMLKLSTAGKGDSAWKLIEQNLSQYEGFSQLPKGQQKFIVGYYADIVSDHPRLFGLKDADVIQPGYGKELAPLFSGKNAVDYAEVLNKAQTFAGR